jgi:hypothetical protein
VFAYGVRVIPWGRVVPAVVLVLVLMDVVRRWPWNMWALEGIAVGLVAAATAWCLDEEAAVVVDVMPRSLAWRTAARLPGIAVVAAAWLLAVHLGRESLFGHAWIVAVQGLAACAIAAAWATWRRSGGDPVPGTVFAFGVVPLVSAWALTRPFPELLPVFPYADGSGNAGSWEVGLLGWSTAAGCAVVLLAAGLAETRWWRLPRRP